VVFSPWRDGGVVNSSPEESPPATFDDELSSVLAFTVSTLLH
jgi:hypothetical protein